MTLRTRFALWISALMLVTLGAFGAFVYLAVGHWLATSLDDSLRLSAAQLIAASDIDHGQLDVSENPVTLDPGLTEQLRARGMGIQVFATSGRLLQALGPSATLSLEPGSLDAALAGRTSLSTRAATSETGEVRVFTQPITAGQRVIAIAQVSGSLANVEALRHTLLATLLLGSPIVIAIAAAGGYLLARRALSPIDEITRTARRISAEDLSRRLDLPDSGDEVGRLAATFDEMLGRLDEAFRRERRFANDAAHELRTPLAVMQSIMGVTRQRRRRADEYESALDDLADETSQLSALTADLLQLAKAESATRPSEPVDLGELVPDVVESLRPAAEAKGLVLTCELHGDLTLSGDTDALIRLLLNLVHNAVKYTAGGSVTVFAEGAGDTVTIRVSDTGEGISPEHLPHVFERFYRADESRSAPGTGLGLAICQEIAHAHCGSIAVTSEPGVGSAFTVALPRTSVPA